MNTNKVDIPTTDYGVIVCTPDGSFWAGLGWKRQLRDAKIYHSKKYANNIIEKFPGVGAYLLPVEIKITASKLD